MSNKHKATEPIYQKIAIDIAEKIADGKYPIGEKLYGRSMLAAQYSVSPETIRRAMFILKDLGIVEVASGSGATVIATEPARVLIQRFHNFTGVTALKRNIAAQAEAQQTAQKELLTNIHNLLDYIEKFRLASPILPYEIEITPSCRFLGKMISEINFWQNTGVTVVAIRKQNEMIISPGPYALLEAGDSFVLVGAEGSYDGVKDYLYGK